MQYQFLALLIILSIALSGALTRKYTNINNAILCLMSGIIIGPFCFNMIDSSYLEILSEIGILLLMFSIGLEIPFKRLKQMKHLILGIGLVHSITMIMISCTILLLTMHYDCIWLLIIGITLSFSSTAITVQVLSERNEFGSKTGKICFALLLLQDIVAISLFVIMGIASSRSAESLNNSSIQITDGMIFILLTVLLIVIIVASPKWIGRIVNEIDSEYRSLFAIFSVIGTSMLTQFLNLSSDLGAFIIGMCCASTPWSHEIGSMISPYRIFTLSAFFILIGVDMNLTFMYHNITLITLLVSLILIVKAIGTIILMRYIYRLSWSKSFNIGILVTGCGEFAFVVFSNPWIRSHLSEDTCALWNTVTGISMILTPIIYTLYRSYFHHIIAMKFDKFINNAKDHSDIYKGKINPALAPVVVEQDSI